MKKTILLLLSGFAFLVACEREYDPNPNPNSKPDPTSEEKKEDPPSNGMDKGVFDLNLFKAECSLNDGNVIISPFSISNVTKMILSGAYGSTESEVLAAYESDSKSDLLWANKNMMGQLLKLDSSLVTCVNAFFYDKNAIEPTAEFKEALSKYFSANEKPLNFTDKQLVLQMINSWVNTHTNGRIPSILNEITDDEVMFLLNAIYLKASWAVPFLPIDTHDDDFTLRNGNKVTVPFMYRDGSYKHSEYGNGEMIELPYKDDELSLFVIRPTTGTLDQYIEGFSTSVFNNLLSNGQYKRFMFYIPKFTLEYKNPNMRPTFEQLGIQNMFTESAELNMCTPSNAYVSRIVHKTFFMIDEKGTEGAAVTAGGVGITSVPPTFRLNQPFMFVLRHNSSGRVLFIGRVENPVD